MGIKERRTKILLSLFLLSDVDLSPASFSTEVQQAFDLSFNQKTRGTLSGLLKEEMIEKVAGEERDSEKETTQYRLTETGFHELALQFPFVRFLRGTWDGKWRILSYEIPEKKRELRDRLRREVSGWGLGPWHRSFWITPHPIVPNLQALVSQREEEKYIQAFESEHAFGDRAVLIEKVWKIADLDRKYRELFKRWHDTLAREGEKTEKFKKVVNEYVDVLREDPGLPTELVGEKWIGLESFTIFKEIRSILLSS